MKEGPPIKADGLNPDLGPNFDAAALEEEQLDKKLFNLDENTIRKKKSVAKEKPTSGKWESEEDNKICAALKEIVGHEPAAADYGKALRMMEEFKKDGEKIFYGSYPPSFKYFNVANKDIDELLGALMPGYIQNTDGDRFAIDYAIESLRRLKREAEKPIREP